VKERFGFHHAVANELVVKNGRLTGGVKINVTHDGKGKWVRRIGRKFNVSPEEMIAIGDSTGDIGMFEMVGLSVAFNSSSDQLKKAADHWIPGPDLRAIIPVLPFGSS